MKAMVELRVLEMMGLVVSWTLELESYGKWCSAFGNWFYPLQNCRLTVLKQGMDELTVSLFIIETQLNLDISLQLAPVTWENFLVFEHFLKILKATSIFKIEKEKIVYLPSKTSVGWNIWVPKVKRESLQWLATYLFLLLLWRWNLYTQQWGSFCSPIDYNAPWGCLCPVWRLSSVVKVI